MLARIKQKSRSENIFMGVTSNNTYKCNFPCGALIGAKADKKEVFFYSSQKSIPKKIIWAHPCNRFWTFCQQFTIIQWLLTNEISISLLVADTTTKKESTCLSQFIVQFNLHGIIIQDRDLFYIKIISRILWNEMERIRRMLNAVQHPWGNGQVERTNHAAFSLELYTSKCQTLEYTKRQDEISVFINSIVIKTTVRTPFELLYGYTPTRLFLYEGMRKRLLEH